MPTIREAIDRVDKLMPNQYTEEQKLLWLSEIDGMINNDVIQTHQAGAEALAAYTTEDMDKQLLVGHPYGRQLYEHWLMAQICLENGEMAKYNQQITLYNGMYQNYSDWYNRSREPDRGRKHWKL